MGMEKLGKAGSSPVDCVVEEELMMTIKNTHHRRFKSEADPSDAFTSVSIFQFSASLWSLSASPKKSVESKQNVIMAP